MPVYPLEYYIEHADEFAEGVVSTFGRFRIADLETAAKDLLDKAQLYRRADESDRRATREAFAKAFMIFSEKHPDILSKPEGRNPVKVFTAAK